MKFRVLLVTGVEVTLISLFIIFFTRRFVGQPIEKLIEGTKAISQMELDKPLDIAGNSEELDELARSFDVMRDRLRTALGKSTVHAEPGNQGGGSHAATQSGPPETAASDRLASLGTAFRQRGARNQQSDCRRAEPLHAAAAHVERRWHPPERIPEFRRYLTQVTNETTRVGRIVSDLLAFSRRSKPQRAPGDVNKIVRMTLSLVQHKMKLSNVEVETKLAEDLPLVPCDQSQMQQVALNLLLNAAEATHGKPERRVAVSTNSGDGVVRLVVADNGEGIPPENLAKIFHPFFTTKPEGKGVGLGLAVSYGIIEAHGGDIEVVSKVGEGTSVHGLAAVAASTGRSCRCRSWRGRNEVPVRGGDARSGPPGGSYRMVRDRCGGEFGLPVREMEIPAVDFAYDRAGGSTAQSPCWKCCADLPADAMKLLAVTERDLFVPGADVRVRAGATGTAGWRWFRWRGCGRNFTAWRPTMRFFRGSSRKEALHETGHMFGLVHCGDRSCAMSLATNVRQIDSKHGRVLRPCGARLRRGAKGVKGYEDHWQILVVDDEEVMCESLAAWLREDGYSVDTAASGREGHRENAGRDYAIYFVDLKMPGGMDGIETMMQMRRCIRRRPSSSSPRTPRWTRPSRR
jgi:signal transduction histidine kinase